MSINIIKKMIVAPFYKYFGFSKAEVNGALILISLMGAYVLVPFYIKKYNKTHKIIHADAKKSKHRLNRNTKPIPNYTANSYRFHKKRIFNKKHNYPYSINNKIDINTASVKQIQEKCNFDIKLSRRIVAYRRLLNGYKNTMQFHNIYDITEEQLAALKNHTYIKKANPKVK